MSPQVDNFVHSLVEMARAQEILPSVEAERDELKGKLNSALDTVQDRELHIIALKSDIEGLNNRIRSLEVERDDANFRVLEAEDLNHGILNMARTAQANLSVILAALDPPNLEPVKEPEPQGSSEVNPTTLGTVASSSSQDQTSVSDTVTQSESASTSPTIPEAVSSISEFPGQSESSPTPSTNPTANTGETQESAGQSPAKSTDVGSTSEVTSSAELTRGPYFGKRYIDVSDWVSYDDWRDGGGTHEGYWAGRR